MEQGEMMNIPRKNLKDITGMKFGRLTAIAFSHFSRRQYWMFVCECGKEKIISRTSVVSGNTRSCGCIHTERAKNLRRTHGLSRTPEHSSWNQMITRCYNSNRKQYKDWGGRGISVCDRWRNDFMEFLKDMGKKPSPGHSLDRIDANGNYEPSNCRWATKTEQAQNKRTYRTNKVGVAGVCKRKSSGKWCARIQVNGVRHDLGEFKSLDEAIEARIKAEIELKYCQPIGRDDKGETTACGNPLHFTLLKVKS